MILEHIEDLIDESEILEFDIDPEDYYLLEGDDSDIDIDEGLGQLFEDAGFENGYELASEFSSIDEAAGAAKGALTAAGAKIATGVQSATLATGTGKLGIGAAAAANPLTTAVAVLGGGAIVALAGAYALARYLGSIGRLNRVINNLKSKVAAEKDSAKKSKLNDKIKSYEQKLKNAQAKARVKKGSFIEKTKQLKNQVEQMKRDKKDTSKLEKKLQARQKVISKIGAKI